MTQNETCCPDPKNWKNQQWHKHGNGASGLYFMGFIGAAIYFIGQAATFGAGVLGFLKALVWPAILVYEVLKFLMIK